ncbi:MAG TPA: helix-turn-helix transcriptional regulator [Clostridiaceae bacterium]|nr:helix-turn-helix transcriptional regulator [Clostridiaceae bacterium]
MHRSKVFYNYLLSYLILLISVFSVITFIFSNVLNTMKKEIEDTVVAQFKQMSIELEKELQSLKDTADLISINKYLTRYKLSSTGYMAVQGIEELARIRSSNSFIYDVFLNFKDDYIYSARGKNTVKVYGYDVLNLNEDSHNTMQENILNPREINYYALYLKNQTAEDNPRYLLCSYPLSLQNTIFASVNFIIETSKIKIMLNNMLRDYDCIARVILPSGEILMQVSNTDENHVFFDDPKYIDKYLNFSYKSDVTMISFDITIKTARMFIKLRQIQNISYTLILLLFTASIFISYLFSKKHYKPIMLLNRMALEYKRVDTFSDANNEFDAIRRVMEFEASENSKLTKRLYDLNPIFYKQTCALLFSGALQDETLIYKMMELSGIEIKEQYYSVMAIVLGSAIKGSSVNTRGICDSLLNRPEYKINQITTILNNNAMVIAVGLPERDVSKKLRRNIAKDIIVWLHQEGYYNNLICFGRVYDKISLINRSYAEAVVSMEQCLLSKAEERDMPVFFEKLTKFDNKQYCLNESDKAALIDNLKNKNLKKANTCFEEMIEKIHEKELSLEICKFHYYDLLLEVFHYLTGIEKNQELISAALNIDCSTTERFCHQMKELFHLICKGDREQNSQVELIEKIIDYIKDNYANSNLTLASLAETFNISPSYLSSYFKEKVGESYIQYLSRIRLKEAYKLICDTDLQIQEITLKVGYIDNVSFTKKFKKMFKVTPMELRQKARNQANSMNMANTMNMGNTSFYTNI